MAKEDRTLRILFAEDVPADVALAKDELRRGGVIFDSCVVNTAAEFDRMLVEFDPELIISAYRFSSFSGMEALKRTQQHDGSIPLIILTGTINEEAAVECLKAGAMNYVLKEHITRLPFAVRDALEKKKTSGWKESELRYRSLFENMLEGYAYCRMVVEDGIPQDFIYLQVNQRFGQLTGLTNVEGKRVTELIPGIRKTNPELFEIYARTASTGAPERFETYVDGLGIWFSISVYSPTKGYFVAVFDNITERKLAEIQVKRLNRVYAVLSDINQTIVRVRDRQKLLEESCRIAVGQGAFLMAWVGMLNDDGRKVDVVASAGFSHDYLSKINIDLKDENRSSGPTGQAVKTGTSVIVNDIASDERMRPWRDDAIKLGYRSAASFPFKVFGKITGAFTLYSAEAGFFDKNERKLLDELAMDISFALEFIQQEAEKKKALEEIEQSRDQFKTLFDDAPIGYHEIDHEGRVTRVNKTELAMLGYKEEEVLGKYIWQFIKDAEQSHRAVLGKLATGVKPVMNYERTFVRKDGKTLPVIVEDKFITAKDGTMVGIRSVVQNITERKRIEERQLLQTTALESAANGVVITDPTGNILWVNSGFSRMTGYTLEDAIGQNPRILKSGRQSDQLYKELWQSISSGNSWKGELINKRKDGTLYDEEITITPVFGEDKKVTHYVAIKQDVSARKQAIEALEKREEEYRRFFEDDLTGDYVSTPDGKVLSCNPAFVRIFGFGSKEEALNANGASLYVEPEEREIFLRLLTEHKKLEYYESEYLRRDGTKVYCIENAIGIFDSNGALTQIRGYVFDETKRKLLEQQLVQAQKLESLGTIASGIAHDFNNILGIILGYASILARPDPNPENVKNNVDAVLKASRRGASLVKQLLTFARKVDVQFQSVRLNDIVNEVSGLLTETIPKTIEIVLALDKQLPSFTGDPSQIHQVLLNLCINARDAMPNGGKLTITTSRITGKSIKARFARAGDGPFITLSVTDTGTGMDQATLSRIFEPFFTTKEVGKGTGLGLAVVFGIVESHKGFIDVESQLGTGSTFHLYFSVLKSEDPDQAAGEEHMDVPGGTETILIVEDEEMLRGLLETALRNAGYTVLMAADGEEALAMLREQRAKITLVLSDIGLPKLSGFDIFRSMKTVNPQLKFIMSSGFLEPQMKSEIFKEGVRDFIQKPYSVYQVLRSVRDVLDQR